MDSTRHGISRRLLLGMAPALAASMGPLTACSGSSPDPGVAGPAIPVPGAVFDPARIRSGLSTVVARRLGGLTTSRLADGLAPPTNRWFSALALGPVSRPVFPLPLSFAVTADGFAFGVPTVTTTADQITGPASRDVTVLLPGLRKTMVTAYDEASVTVAFLGTTGALGQVLLARGSPYLTLTAHSALTIRTNIAFAADRETAAASGRRYGAVIDGSTFDGTRLELAAQDQVTWFPVPDGTTGRKMAAQVIRLTGTDLGYAVAAQSATTRITYRGNGSGAFGVLLHQRDGLAAGITNDLGSLPTVFGRMAFCSGSVLQWSTPVRPLRAGLPVESLSGTDRARLAAQVRADITGPVFPADTYFGGKALQRMAHLWMLARQLGLSDAAATAKAALVAQLDLWTDPTGARGRSSKCFVYDESARGLIGLEPSFGSQGFSDHHFHYGYFLYTAGILASTDPGLIARWRPMMDLVAADLASSGGTGLFPDRRTFDAYAGQSWASGSAPFDLGNNQESSSEAANAWIGLGWWATATDNPALAAEAAWMLAGEARAALRYGLYLDGTDPVYHGYQQPMVSLTFGGQRSYRTWFSDQPAAKLAIQLLPASPTARSYLRSVPPDRIRWNVQSATTSGGFAQPFGDYALMYSALAGAVDRRDALTTARGTSRPKVDPGNSAAYLLAWLLTADR